MKILSSIRSLLTRPESLFFLVILFVNAGNYGVNLLLGRFLGPASYAEAGAVATIILTLSFISISVQMCFARITAEMDGQEAEQDLKAVLRSFMRRIVSVSVFASILALFTVPTLTDLFKLQSSAILAIVFLSMPFYISMSAKRGIAQGLENFQDLARSFGLEFLIRVGVTLAILFLGSQLHLDLSGLAIAGGYSLAFVWLSGMTKLIGNTKVALPSKASKRFFLKVFAGLLIYEFCQVVLNHSDVLLVKHYFDSQEAGLYNALALIGRMVFYASWIVVMMYFPKIIKAKENRSQFLLLCAKVLAMVAAIGLGIIIGSQLFGEAIISLVFGAEYLGLVQYLVAYACATLLFALANALVYFFVSLNDYRPIFLALAFGIVQVVAMSYVADSILNIVYCQVYFMSALLLILTCYFIFFISKNYQRENCHSFAVSSK